VNLIRCGLAALLVIAPIASAQADPSKDPDLDRLTGQLSQLDADPSLGSLGAVERLKAHQALTAMAQTDPRSKDRPFDMYLADRAIAIAQFAAQAELAEHQLDQLDRERDRILLEASRRDADQARQEAERLRLQNKARDEENERAQAQQEAQQEQAASIANDTSDQAHALAQARAKAAALAQQEAALTSGAPLPKASSKGGEPRGPSTALSGAAFVPGHAAVRNDARSKAAVRAVVAFVQAHPDAMIRIEGHTDNRSDAQTSLTLSQQRADAVRNVLRAAGIADSRIQAIGLGAEQPVASNATAEGRERNSRIEVIALRGSN
jgi:outer membrane protein OmpA-like peptidoglycan-associated protein